jgi:hypothetical protein
MSAAAMTASSQPIQGGSPMPQIHLSKINLNYIVLLFLIVGITFVQNVPIEWRRWTNTLVGGVVGLGAVYGSWLYFNWHTSLLVALFLLICMNTSGVVDGFEPGLDTRIVAGKKKWYIEQVLGENPLLIEEDTVKTSAIQDDNSGMSRSIQSGSNL